MESGLDFVACDNPHANRLMVHMLAAFAEHERDMISQRTKDKIVLNDATVETDVTGSFKDERKVQWDYRDGGWVPTSVDLYLIEETNLRASASFDVSDVGVVSAAGYQLIALTTILRDGELPPPEPVFLAHEPYKHVIELPATSLNTTIYSGKTSKASRLTVLAPTVLSEVTCKPEEPMPSGYVTIGGARKSLMTRHNNGSQLIPRGSRVFPLDVVDSPSQHCVNENICSVLSITNTADVPVTFCVTLWREAGCYVNQTWLSWYEERERKLPDVARTGSDRIDEICAKGYLTR